jgi:FtsP/CotA-like multicopper oxidase with cupredoxin domain
VRSGRSSSVQLTAAAGTLDLAGRHVQTWLFNGKLHGPEIRLSRGDLLMADVRNDLPTATSIHWHGLALRNDMDGVPGMTGPSIASGGRFRYHFTVPDAGTYWYHPHVGVQLDRGLYGPLIVEDPDERSSADVEHVLVLDDWLDGMPSTPDAQLAALRSGGMGAMSGMGGMSMTGTASGVTADRPLGADGGDVQYPLHLVNGRPPGDPQTFMAKPGQSVRLRLINAGADTAYRFAVAGHRLTITHADGFAVQPVTVDALIVGMGERYDVRLTAGDGVFAVVAVPESKPGAGAFALLRTGIGRRPLTAQRPSELTGRLLSYADLHPRPGTELMTHSSDRLIEMVLGMSATGYRWTLNGKAGENQVPALSVRPGERLRIRYRNASSMFHPMHVHGHTFALLDPTGPGTRKDTVIVPPGRTVTTALTADNPGQWMLHCHNAYHQEAGMAARLSYRT